MIDIDTQLREVGERWRAAQPEPHVDFTRIAVSGRSRRIVAAAVVAVAAAALVAIGLMSTHTTRPTNIRITGEPTTSSTTASPRAVIGLNREITQVQTFTAVAGKLWVTGDAMNDGPAHVQQIDPTSGAPNATRSAA